MSHTLRDKKKLLNRIRRIRGQVDAIERALENEEEPGPILQLITSSRGAINGLMAQIIEGHIDLHLIDKNSATDHQREAAADVLAVIKTYLK
jgi:DNA-binding FrmR family transcriptional regulator